MSGGFHFDYDNPHENYQFDQWSGTVSSFEPTITLFGTKDHHLTASLVETPYQIETLRVFDLMGKQVLHKTPNQQKLTLNTFTLAPGAYLLRVETPEGEQTVKLIKK
ncbi:MAG: T9SS C-terminal target domain-containing protein [Flavobacteriaceae bacterium TMED81]|nr:MAG: T9SS C-terminal target domain-containing protein [Flavobacteriaceae bacterium TMED81]